MRTQKGNVLDMLFIRQRPCDFLVQDAQGSGSRAIEVETVLKGKRAVSVLRFAHGDAPRFTTQLEPTASFQVDASHSQKHLDFRGLAREVAVRFRRFHDDWCNTAADQAHRQKVAAEMAKYGFTAPLQLARAFLVPGRVPWTPAGLTRSEGGCAYVAHDTTRVAQDAGNDYRLDCAVPPDGLFGRAPRS